MKRVLILNHQHEKCGVYQIGLRIFNLASLSKKVEYVYRVVDSWDRYNKAIIENSPDFIVYNWHWDRMPWLREIDITGNKYSKHYFIYHDGSMMPVYDKYLLFGAMPPVEKFKEDGAVLLPRPLYTYNGEYPVNEIPTIGSFGFAFNHKKFHNISQYVGQCFDKARVNLHFTNPYFGDTPGNKLEDIIELCKSTCPSNVELNITNNFISYRDLLRFLAGNDVNLFMYDETFQNPGISSATDYALSVKRPIAITNNMMFRHIMSDDICIEKTPLNIILTNGTKPLERYYKEWSTDSFVTAMENLFI
jgi:hypothetical protein